MSSIVFDKNVVELVTVAAEYCAFLDKTRNSLDQSEFLDKEKTINVLMRILPLLYLKALMVPDIETDPEVMTEEYVSESDYNSVCESLKIVLGEIDDYLEVCVDDMRYSDTPIRCSISEDLSDIYQALKNFVESFQTGINDTMRESIAVCKESFYLYWGQTLTNTLRALHFARFGIGSGNDLFDQD